MMDKVWLEDTEFWEMKSNIMDYTYDIKVSIPKEEAPENGFPIYYMLDGNWYFQMGRDVVRLQAGNGPKTLISPAIVVGIGHKGTKEDVGKRRFYEFTPFAETYKYPERFNGTQIWDHGGAEKLLAFIEQELMPIINEKYAVNRDKQTLFGHSLSGLFVVWALFKRPDLFPYYVATSPSIWWNEHELFMHAEQYFQEGLPHAHRKLLMLVGSEEDFMVDDAKQLYAKMSEHKTEQLEVELYIAEDENHASVVPTIMSRAFRYMNK
ncbi:alpha/beta hydrolase-fold protein [Psychrobacillus sp. NEAU-3TGS]|nr:alpha/beta hydrolase-fold protein [Psychrobacillus sp. NEAU-3TGS]